MKKLLLGVAMAGMAATVCAQKLEVGPTSRSIAITATDTAEGLADQAVVTVGYLDYGPDEATAYANGSKRSNAIVAALAKFGVPKDAIESADQDLRPLNEYEIKNLKAEQKSYRYQISQSWTVKTDPEKAAKVLDAAVKAGANSSGNIGWQMKDTDALEAQAAAKAIAHAKRIADRMAEGLGIKLGKLLYASNQQQSVAPRPMMMMARAAVADAKEAEPLAISARKISQSVTVYAVFEIQ